MQKFIDCCRAAISLMRRVHSTAAPSEFVAYLGLGTYFNDGEEE